MNQQMPFLLSAQTRAEDAAKAAAEKKVDAVKPAAPVEPVRLKTDRGARPSIKMPSWWADTDKAIAVDYDEDPRSDAAFEKRAAAIEALRELTAAHKGARQK